MQYLQTEFTKLISLVILLGIISYVDKTPQHTTRK